MDLSLNMPDPRAFAARPAYEAVYPGPVATRYEQPVVFEDSYMAPAPVEYTIVGEPYEETYISHREPSYSSYSHRSDSRSESPHRPGRYPILRSEDRRLLQERDDDFRKRRNSDPTSAKKLEREVRKLNETTKQRDRFIDKQQEKLEVKEQQIKNLKKQLAAAKNNQRSFGTRQEDYEISRLRRENEKLKKPTANKTLYVEREPAGQQLIMYDNNRVVLGPDGTPRRMVPAGSQHSSFSDYSYDNGYGAGRHPSSSRPTTPKQHFEPGRHTAERLANRVSSRSNSPTNMPTTRSEELRRKKQHEQLKAKERGWGSNKKKNDKFAHVKPKVYDELNNIKANADKLAAGVGGGGGQRRHSNTTKGGTPTTHNKPKRGNSPRKGSPARRVATPTTASGVGPTVVGTSQPPIVVSGDPPVTTNSAGYRSYVSRVYYDDPSNPGAIIYENDGGPIPHHIGVATTPPKSYYSHPTVLGEDPIVVRAPAPAAPGTLYSTPAPVAITSSGVNGRFIAENRRVIGENVYTLPPEDTGNMYARYHGGYVDASVIDSGEAPIPTTRPTETF